MLHCSRCGEDKAEVEFSPQPSSKRGRATWCKPCNAAYARERYQRVDVRAKKVEKSRAMRKEPDAKARISEYNKRYRAENRERMQIHDNNPEKRARDRANAKTPEGRLGGRLREQKRRARVAGAGEGVTAEQWSERLVEFNYSCAYCLGPGPFQIEHMTPISRGGAHSLENIVPSCGPCNYSKGTKNLLEFLPLMEKRM